MANAPAAVPVPDDSQDPGRPSSHWIVLSWVALLGFAAFIAAQADAAPIFFPFFIPLLLLVFVAHTFSGQDRGYGWSLAALGACAIPIPILFPSLSRPEAAVLCADWLMGLAALHIADSFLQRLRERVRSSRSEIQELETQMKSILQEKDFYQKKIPHLRTQIGARQRLSAFAREMSVLLVPETVKQKLIQELQRLFPQDSIALHSPAALKDPFDQWIAEKKSSLLVGNPASDQRFSPELIRPQGIGSLIAAPLYIERSLMGTIRVESSAAERFDKTDLQELELYAHISTLALENAQLFGRVNAMATKDGLTSLATHRVFQEKLNDEVLRAARYHKNVCLVMVDIDHFKSVNDRYGHLAGDQVLQIVARILLAHCREYDFAARYGGEEFCLIFPEVGLDKAAVTAERIRQQIAQTQINAAPHLFQVTASLGCASFPEDAQSASQLVRMADQRLYRAKSGGRNRVVKE